MPRLTVDTGMDTKPVLNGIRDMNSAIRSLRSVVSQAGKDMDVAVVGYAKAMRNNAAASREAKARVQELDSAYAALIHELEAMAMTKYMTPEFVEFTNELHKQEDRLARLNSARRKDVTAINETEKEIRRLKQALQDLKDEGKAFTLGSETEEYARLEKQARDTVAAANKIRALADEKLAPLHIQEWNQMATATGAVANGIARVVYAGQMLGHAILHPFQALNRIIPMVVSGLGSLAKKAWDAAVSLAKTVVRNVISFMHRLGDAARNAAINLARLAGTAIVSGIKNIGSLAAKAGKAILSVGKSAKRGNTSLKQAVTLLIRYGFGVRSIFMLVRRLRTALVDAFKNMAQAVPEVNVVLSQLSASLGQMKNSLATAFQPVLSAVAPMLNVFMNMVTEAMTRVGMFFAALTGQDYVYKAKKANFDLAKSLDKTKKSAKEAENQLAGFDHLNILKAPNDSGSNSGANANAADSGGFQQIPLLESIKNFADKLKNMLLNGEFAELGKVLAEKVNGLFNSIDLQGIAQKLGGLINNAVAFYNAFMEGIDWQNIGKKFAEGINGLLDSVNWTELGRALSQRINAIWGILYGLVTNVNWAQLGKSLSEAVWGWFGNIKWDLIGKTIGEGINGISTALINFANNFPWKETGSKIASGLNNLFDTVNLQTVVDAFLKLLNGALDSLLEIVSEFKWGENGEKFRLAVLKLIENFPAEKLGHLLTISIKGILDLISPTISDPKVWRGLGERLGTFMNTLFGDREMWKGIGETANGMLNGILIFGQSFLDTFKEDEAAENIKTALAQIDFESIATNTWNLIKTAFAKAGSFVDALFSEDAHLDPEVIKNRSDPVYAKIFEDERNAINAFNAQSLGARVGQRIREALSKIPWADIASSMWENAKKLIASAQSNTADFFTAIFNISDSDIDNAGGNKAKAIGKKIGGAISEAIGKINWKDFGATLSTAVTNLFNTINGLFQGLGEEIIFVDGRKTTKLQKAIEDFFDSVDWESVAKSIVGAAWSAFKNIGKALLGAIVGEEPAKETEEAIMSYRAKVLGKIRESFGEIELNNIRMKLADTPNVEALNAEELNELFKVNFSAIEWDAILNADEAEAYVNASWDKLDEYVREQGYDVADSAAGGYIDGTNDKKPEVEEAINKAFTIPLDPNVQATNTETAGEYANSATNTYISTLSGRNSDVEEANSSTFTSLPSPDQLSQLEEYGMLRADKGVDGYIQEADARASEIEETSKTVFTPDVSDAAKESGVSAANTYTESVKNQFATASTTTGPELASELGNVFGVVQNSMPIWANATVNDYYDAFKARYTENGEVKEGLRTAVDEILGAGASESFKNGDMTAEKFYNAYQEYINSHKGEAQTATQSAFADITDQSEKAKEGATNTVNAAVDGYTQSMQGRKFDVDEANKTLVFPDMSEPAKQNAEKTANDSMSAYIGLLLSRQPNDETAVQNVFNTIWGAIDAGGNGEMLALGYMSEFLNTATDESGRVKPEFVDVIESMFGSADALSESKGGITAEQFLKGLIQGYQDSSGETSTKLVEIIDSILTNVETSPDGFEQGSPSKRAARSGQYYMEGLQNGIDDNADATETTMTNAMNRVVGVVDDKWNEVTETQGKYLRGMEGNTSTGMTNITNDVSAGTTDQRQPVYDNWDLIATFVRLTLEGMKTDVQSAMNSMLSAMQSGMSSMKSAVESGVNGIGNSLSNGMGSVVNAVNGIDWWSVGDNIVAGIIDGMNDNWKYLKSTAKTLANNLLVSTKNALGIASPSRLFRDEVGVMLGLGIAEGMEDSQPAILGSVSDVADAMVDKMNGTDMAFNVGTDAALDSFSDKITNSFTTLLDRLQSIADRVTFQTPTIATGTVLPYNVQAQSANGSKDIVNALEVSNDDLANVIIQATNNAVSALVEAIRRSGNTSGGDLNSQTSRIIDEINRRTRAQGTSPIIV